MGSAAVGFRHALNLTLLTQKGSHVIKRQSRMMDPVVVPIAPIDCPPEAVKQPHTTACTRSSRAEPLLYRLVELAYLLVVLCSHGLIVVTQR